MTRNVRTYDHFCVVARALEQVGDRWSLLVVRDLLSGPKRFTDLAHRLGGITPKTLTQRLRELDDAGIVTVEREQGRREVWYRLTRAGEQLAPAIDALAWWGLRHAWRPPHPGEPMHVEHLLQALVHAIARTPDNHQPTNWHFEFADNDDYTVEYDGQTWSLTAGQPPANPDVVITATTDAWTQFFRDPSPRRAKELRIDITGSATEVLRCQRLLRALPEAVSQSEQASQAPA